LFVGVITGHTAQTAIANAKRTAPAMYAPIRIAAVLPFN